MALNMLQKFFSISSFDLLLKSSNLMRRLVYRNFTTSNVCHKTWQKKLRRQDAIESNINQQVGRHNKRAHRVYIWGWAATGALGVRKFVKPQKNQKPRQKVLHPYLLPFFTENGLRVLSVGCGYGFSVFLCQNDTETLLYGTGINTDAQLSYHEYPPKSGRILDYLVEPASIPLPLVYPRSTRIQHIACGRAHTVVATDNEGVFSFGNNSYGQCGRNIIENEIYSGSQQINRIPIAGSIKQLSCGQDHTLFLNEAGHVFSCGLGSDGQTGLGHYELQDSPCQVKGDIEGEQVVQLSSKGDCTLAVSDKGDVFGWGNSEYEQLSIVAKDSTQVSVPRHLPFKHVGKVIKTAAAGSMCALLNDQGQVFVWGYGLLGKGPKLHSTSYPEQIPETLFGRNEFTPDSFVVDIQCGLTHFLAITNKGELFAWGRNKSACLGLSFDKDQFFPFKVIVPAEVETIACGVDHTIALCRAFS